MIRVIFLLMLAAITSRAGAQKQPVEVDSCLYRIPASAFKRVPVFLEATADSASRAILPGADLFAQSVAFKLRELVGGNEAKLAEADSSVWWASLWGEVVVTVTRAGPLTWRVADWSVGADTLPKSALAVLRGSIEAVASGGELIPLPEGKGDSWSFGLSLVHPLVTKDGRLIPVKARQPVPVFTLLVPWEQPVEMIRLPRLEYSEFSRRLGATGAVRLSFVVDKSGRANPETVKEVFLAGEKRPVGEDRVYADGFIRAVKRALPSAKFAPAAVGGCALNQVVQQVFDFRWGRNQLN
jgi:hypothetical protein